MNPLLATVTGKGIRADAQRAVTPSRRWSGCARCSTPSD